MIGADGKLVSAFSGDGIAERDLRAVRRSGPDARPGQRGRAGGGLPRSPSSPEDTAWGLARFNLDGSPDESFATPVYDPAPGFRDFPTSIDLHPDGGFFVVGPGSIPLPPAGQEYARADVLRLRPNGVPDLRFGPGGIQRYAGPTSHLYPSEAAIDQAGRLLVVGHRDRRRHRDRRPVRRTLRRPAADRRDLRPRTASSSPASNATSARAPRPSSSRSPAQAS